MKNLHKNLVCQMEKAEFLWLNWDERLSPGYFRDAQKITLIHRYFYFKLPWIQSLWMWLWHKIFLLMSAHLQVCVELSVILLNDHNIFIMFFIPSTWWDFLLPLETECKIFHSLIRETTIAAHRKCQIIKLINPTMCISIQQ